MTNGILTWTLVVLGLLVGWAGVALAVRAVLGTHRGPRRYRKGLL